MLKDLIISGNQVLQTALDKFNNGDGAELQGIYIHIHLDKKYT